MLNRHFKLRSIRQTNKDTHIFSTEISSLSHLDNQMQTQPKSMIKISSKFTQQPGLHLKKLKIQTKQLDEDLTAEQRHFFNIRNSLQTKYKEISLSRYQFLKLYSVKKQKKEIKQLKDSCKNQLQTTSKQNLYKVKKQRYGEQVSIVIRREQNQKMMQQLRDKNNSQRKTWKQTILENQLRFSHTIYDKIKKRKQERLEAELRKKNHSELSTTRSKFNYLLKINNEMQAIKNYQDLLDNPEELIKQRLSQSKGFSNTFTTGFNKCSSPYQY